VSQARESARLNRLRFAEGALLSSDLMGVEDRLTDALVRRIVAETAQRIAVADLRRALGLPQFVEDSELPPESLSEKDSGSPINPERGN
jgi:outer membrane protein TolC